MFRKIYAGCFLFFIIGFCTQCHIPPVPHPDPGLPPGGGTDVPKDPVVVDTTTNLPPDTTIIRDTVKAVVLDSALAFTRRFGNELLFTAAQLETRSGVFRQAKDYKGRAVNLDFSFIAPAADTMKHRPFILMVHEGAFLFGSLENEMGKARYLARRGYAAASINYRLGFNGGSEQNACGGNSTEVVQAVYRAVQDTYAALHYFAEHAEEYHIDPGQIILAGSSAGAITISALLYMTEADFEALIPGIVKSLGPLDPDKDGAPYTTRALLSYLGYGIFKSGYINAYNAKPSVFFQRTGDNVLPFQKGTFLSCPYYLNSEGAKPVSDQLKKLKVPFELNYQPEMGHILSYTEEYLTGRYAQFMKRLWAGNLRYVVNENIRTVEDTVIR